MDLSFYADTLADFTGSGLNFTLLLVGLLYLGIRLKKSEEKTLMFFFPIYVLAVFFCPVWVLYNMLREDGVILYRLLWMIPVGIIVCFVLVEAVSLLPAKKRSLAFVGAVLLIMLSGKYVYSNPQFSKAENMYHVPAAVVKICDELRYPGREIRVCMPMEFMQYSRQYSPYICLTYGRYVLLYSSGDVATNIDKLLSKDIISARDVSNELRWTDTPYIVLSGKENFDESLTNYGFDYYMTIDGYDIYFDSTVDLTFGSILERK